MAAVWNLLLSQRIFSNLSYRWREREKVRGRRGGREGGRGERGGGREEGGEERGREERGRGRSDRGQALITTNL